MGAGLTREALLEHFTGRVAKWWIPDDVAFIPTLPLGATGKVLKTELRKQFQGYKLPSA
jgi:3-(methylthio)propionyl---CoA ligase